LVKVLKERLPFIEWPEVDSGIRTSMDNHRTSREGVNGRDIGKIENFVRAEIFLVPSGLAEYFEVELTQLLHLRTWLYGQVQSIPQKREEIAAYRAIRGRRKKAACRLAQTQHDYLIVGRIQPLIGTTQLRIARECAAGGVDLMHATKLLRKRDYARRYENIDL